MTRGALTLGQVLEEEYEYVSGKDARTAEERGQCWAVLGHEISEPRELCHLVAQASAPSRFALLGKDFVDAASLPTLLEQSDDYLRNALANRFFILLNKEDLANELLRDPDVMRFALDDDHAAICAALLELPRVREVLLGNPQFLEGFLSDPTLTAVTDELDGSDDLRAVLRDKIFADLVRSYPQLLGVLIDDVVIRERIARDNTVRTNLVLELGHARKKFFGLKPPKTLQIPRDAKKLHTLTGSSTALRAVMDGATVDEALARSQEAPSTPVNGLTRGNGLLLEAAFGRWIGEHRSVNAILRTMSQEQLAAVCFSGGGIRSATFNLGVLQALARRGILAQFHYLSTVSGGGYIGAWLSSWMRRHNDGADGVIADLGTRMGDPVDPEPRPLRYLRDYSRYLAPRAGIFSVDLWTIVAIYVRNLLLNSTLLLPPLFALLLLPRFAETVLMDRPWMDANKWLATSFGLMTLAMCLFAGARPKVQVVAGEPKTDRELRAERLRTTSKLLPIIVAAVFVAIGIGWHIVAIRKGGPPDWRQLNLHLVGAVFLVANTVGALYYFKGYGPALLKYDDKDLNQRFTRSSPRWAIVLVSLPRLVLELIGAWIAGFVAWGIVYVGVRTIMDRAIGGVSAEMFVCFSVPLVLLIFIVEGGILLAVTTTVSSDHEREWVARAASGVLLAGIAWIAVTGTALLVPLALYQAPTLAGGVGAITGALALLTGRSGKTAAGILPRESTTLGRALSALMGAAATVCLIVIGAALSITATELCGALSPKVELRTRHTPTSRVAVNTTITPDGSSEYGVQITTESQTPFWTLNGAAERHLQMLRFADLNFVWFLFTTALAMSLLTSLALDVNTYSMHSMYRNRLIRAYLGASRWRRRPHAFTGFDPQDDFQMHQLRPELLWGASFHDFMAFLERIQTDNSGLWTQLPSRVREQIVASTTTSTPVDKRLRLDEIDLRPIVLGAINECMQTRDFERDFAAAVANTKLIRRNRTWLDEHYGDCIKPLRSRPPLHVVNLALNLVAGEKLAWQQRKADSFTISPLHSGSHRLGYRDTREYGGGDGGITLGTATAISGAAVSPNMGYHSSSAVTALMTLFNARLGWWLGNPGSIGETTFRRKGPQVAIYPLLREAMGLTHKRSEWIFLSDGGHFENLGLYEMVLRRCKYIIVCDATADDKYVFNDLGNAVRKIRIDFGIPIDFEAITVEPADPKDPTSAIAKRYCASATIGYSAVDNPTLSPRLANRVNGKLLYIKPVVLDDCPVDIRNYRNANPKFPHESTGDQFFSETQFESYRALGAHSIERILRGIKGPMDIERFFEAAFRYVKDGEARRLRRRRQGETAAGEAPGSKTL